MDLMSYKKTVAIIYTSITGNTADLSRLIYRCFQETSLCVSLFSIKEFPISSLEQFDGVIIGTYTWGDGEIPEELVALYEKIEETKEMKQVKTAVFGTGDRFYANFCGAVDHLCNMLFVHTQLVVSLKIELTPQPKDIIRCKKFVELFLQKINQN